MIYMSDLTLAEKEWKKNKIRKKSFSNFLERSHNAHTSAIWETQCLER